VKKSRAAKPKARSELASIATRNVIDSRRLFYFFHVARMRTFSAAEAVLDVAQPAISRQIQQLEAELGVQLLERTGRGVSLTQAGGILYRQAAVILDQMSETLEEIERSRRRPVRQVSIAASAGVMALYMPHIIRRFIAAFPEVQLTAIQASTGEVYDHLAAGQVDVAIILHAPNTQKLSLQQLNIEPLLLVASRAHPVASQDFVSRESLAQLDLVLPAAVHGMRHLLEQYFAAGGIDLAPRLYVDSVPLIKAIVAEGKCCGFLPKSNCDTDLDPAEFVALPLKPALTRTLHVACLRDRADDALVKALMRDVMTVFRDHAGGAAPGPEVAAPARARKPRAARVAGAA